MQQLGRACEGRDSQGSEYQVVSSLSSKTYGQLEVLSRGQVEEDIVLDCSQQSEGVELTPPGPSPLPGSVTRSGVRFGW